MFIIRCPTVDDTAAIARVCAQSRRSTYKGIVQNDYLDSIDVEDWAERQRRNMAEYPNGLISHVAEVQSEVVGWAAGGPNDNTALTYSGELYAIYLLPEYQRRGIGFKLTMATAEWLIESGMSSMIVWVLAENWPARHFYQAFGGSYVQEGQFNIGGASLREVSYGWKDLRALVKGKTEPYTLGVRQ